MRINLPVTGREQPLPAGTALVSVTDLKGRITYGNPSFVQVSGYTLDELLGQPHNIVRHPDMPAEAFRDMWQCVAAGRPWTGIVKNRSRNGDHYWVRANVTPMKRGADIVGYLSVRTAPERGDVEAAERLYQTMRAEAMNGRLVHVLDRGRVRRRGVRGRLAGLLALDQPARIALLMLCTATGPAAAVTLAGAWGWATVPLVLAVGAHVLRRVTFGALGGVLADANRLAAGDLSRPIATGAPRFVGELQNSLAQLSVNLRSIIVDTRAEIANVRQSAREIASGNLSLSGRTSEQAASLARSAASMEQIHATTRQCVDAATDGARQAERTAEATQRGSESVQQVDQTMHAIRASSSQIERITGAVESVAFQTNMLALNAAVEAARAGEAGRGFAVVATEVRALAQRASASAREIQALISESAGRVAAGSDSAAQARERMDGVLGDVNQVARTLEGIRRSADEQQRGVAQISESVSQLDGITQQNAALVEQLAESAQALQHQMEVVDNSLHIFRLRESDTTVAERDAVALRRERRAPAPA